MTDADTPAAGEGDREYDPWDGLAEELSDNGFTATAEAVRLSGGPRGRGVPDGLVEDVRVAYQAAISSGMPAGLLLYVDVRLAHIVLSAAGDGCISVRSEEQAKVIRLLYALETRSPYGMPQRRGDDAGDGGDDGHAAASGDWPVCPATTTTNAPATDPAMRTDAGPAWVPLNPAPADAFRA